MQPGRKLASATVFIALLNLVAAASDREGRRYPRPPARPTAGSWPSGLAAVISEESYLDGFNWTNPGLVRTSEDTFYYGGDTAALNRFLDGLSRVAGLEISVGFARGHGRVDRDFRASSVRGGQVGGLPLSEVGIGGRPCSWLVTITPKEWVGDRWVEGGEPGAKTRARVLVFLGDARINPEDLSLPSWRN